MEVATFSPRPKGSTNKDYCAVSGCRSIGNKDLHLSFHRFPKPNERFVNNENALGESEKIDVFKAWQSALNISNVKPKTRVCSLHFKKNDYFFSAAQARRKCLKKIAIPSLNLPVDKRKKVNKSSKQFNEKVIEQHLKETIEQPQEQQIFQEIEIQSNVTIEHENYESEHLKETVEQPQEQQIFQEIEIEDNVIIEHQNHESGVEDIVTDPAVEIFIKEEHVDLWPPIKDAEVQVNTDCYAFSILHCLKTDSNLHVATGIKSFELLNTIVEILKKECGDKYEKLTVYLKTRDRVIMTYMKLKQNIPYSFLAILFNCYTEKHCQRIFCETLELLNKCLKTDIQWPLRLEILKSVTKYLKGSEDVCD